MTGSWRGGPAGGSCCRLREYEEATHSVGGAVSYQRFRPKAAKSIIDEINRVLAEHYGFTEEELDFIVNYNIKYRMGQGGQKGSNCGVMACPVGRL